MKEKLRTDWFLFSITAFLALFGAVMVYSASAMISLKETAEAASGPTEFQYFTKQIVFASLGIVAMLAVSRIDYRKYNKSFVIALVIAATVALLMGVFAFGAINGAKRWIRVPGISFQPSELAKIALPMFLAWFLTRREKSVGNLKETVLPCLGVMAVLCGLIMLEPDLGTTAVLCGIFVSVYFAAGAKFTHIGIVAALIGLVGAAALIFAPWRVARLLAFIDPCGDENKLATGYQVCQSLMGIGSGGVLGSGFAKGSQKLFYLPYPYSDFIFATIGEELGLVGTLAVVVAFALLLWRGTKAALSAPDRFGMLLGMGIVTGIIAQALFNISVVTSILPAKGIPLPFISYGGSSIVVTLAAVGVLLNISRYSGTKSTTMVSSSVPAPSKVRRKGSRK